MVYQRFKDQVIGAKESHEQEGPVERQPENYLPLMGSRHVDPSTGLTYETVEIKITPQRDIVAWRRRVIKVSYRMPLKAPSTHKTYLPIHPENLG
jgi:hypothetical protein